MAAGSLWASQQSSGLRVCEALYLDMGQLGGWQPGLRGPVSGHGAARGMAAGVKVIVSGHGPARGMAAGVKRPCIWTCGSSGGGSRG